MKLVECVPNFSEGRNMEIIKKITDEIDTSKITEDELFAIVSEKQ